MHAIDERTGGLGEKLQQLLYVEPDQLEKEDKTRVALVCLLHQTICSALADCLPYL